MIPVAIGHGDGGETRAPMGVAVIGGLITSTFLTLFVVPVIYTLLETVGQFFGRLWSRITGSRHEASEPAHAE
jgi:HAE1 family hydrophobic/amphiphilic exporter-1